MKKGLSWLFIFSTLGFTSYFALQPQNQFQAALAYAAERERVAVVAPLDDSHEESTLRRLFNRLNKKDYLCYVTSEEAEELNEIFETETETHEVDGKEVTVFKIQRDVSKKEVLDALENDDCKLVPSRKWFYLILTGQHVS